MLLPLAATVLAWQCVLLGKLPGWGIGLGGKRCSIYCRVLHTATLALFLACLARVRIVQNTDISARCKKKMHPDKNITRKKVLIRYSAQNSCGNFHRETANPPRSRLSRMDSELAGEHATTASASNARLKRSLRKFSLRPSGQNA